MKIYGWMMVAAPALIAARGVGTSTADDAPARAIPEGPLGTRSGRAGNRLERTATHP